MSRKIKQSPVTGDARVVMTAGYHADQRMKLGMEAGVEAHQVKPLDKIQLFISIESGGYKSMVASA